MNNDTFNTTANLLDELPKSRQAGWYIHLPFCRVVCPYCNFSVVKDKAHEPYLSALKRSFQPLATKCKPPTIYIGGGTPSRLSLNELASLLEMMPIGDQTDEVTLEANPEDLNSEYLRVYRDIGINRLSIGVQRLDVSGLKQLGRAASMTAIDMLPEYLALWRELGGTASIDLIYGLPEESPREFARQVSTVESWSIDHLSAYALTIEPGTPFADAQNKGRKVVADPDTSAACYTELVRLLTEKDWDCYEVSNFARRGYRAKHNSAYWQSHMYLGFGQSAVSSVECESSIRYRLTRESEFKPYLESPENFVIQEQLSDPQKDAEKIMLGLRSFVGVELHLWERWQHVQPQRTQQLVAKDILFDRGGRISMNPLQRMLADEVAAHWIAGIEAC